MKQFLSKTLRKIGAKLFGGVALASIFTVGMLSAGATAPAFNNLPNEPYPTLQVAHANAGYTTTTSAQMGEVLTMLVWDHQTVPNTVAHNVTVKVALPATASTSQVSTATVSADNASNTATGSATVNVNPAAHLAYIPGTAQLMRNVNGNMQVVNWMSGVNPDTVVTTGVNLGDQAGCNCFQYAQAVRFQVRVEGTHPVINANKKVEAAGGSQGFADTASTQPGSAVNFRVFLQNTGDGTGYEPVIVDTLDSHLQYIPNSSLMLVKRNNQDVQVPIPDSAIRIEGQKMTWGFDNMAPQPEAALYLIFQARVAPVDQFNVGTTHLSNCATAAFTGVTFNTNCVDISVIRSGENSFTIRKEVTNDTLGDAKWYNRDQLGSAKPGDELKYRLSITNTGSATANNVTIKDILPAGVAFDGNVMLYDHNHPFPNGLAISGDDIVKNGYVLSSFGTGSANEVVIEFKAKVTQNCDGTPIVQNDAQVIFGGQVKAEDNAGTIVSCTRGLIIVKLVQDPKTGEFKHDIGEVAPGTTLVYRITVQNNGTTWANHPILRDVIPAQSTYIANSLTIDDEVMSQQIQDAFFNGGVTLTDLNPGHGKTIYVKFKVNGCPALKTDLINTAFVKADNVGEINDTARAFENICTSPTPTPTPPTTPKPTPPAKPFLPKTGPEAAGFAFVGMSGAAAGISRYYYLKAQLKKSLRNIHIA